MTGQNSAKFITAIPNAHLYCFEPDARAIVRFKNNPMLRTDHVHLYEVAIGSRTGRTTFYPSTSDDQDGGGFDQSGSIRSPKNTALDHPWVKFGKPITVQTLTLDDWCRDNKISDVDFIWMDVQGAERDVIDGGTQTLRKTRFIYTEYSNNELYEGQIGFRENFAKLPQFAVIKRYSGDVLLQNKDTF